MLLMGFRGLQVEEAGELLDAIADHGLGGVLIFDRDLPSGSSVRNVESPEQLSALISGLQDVSLGSSSGLPLLVAVDQEGGQVARLRPEDGFPPVTPSAAELGRLGEPAATRAAGGAIGQTLASVGVNLDLAPVVDLNVNPRSPAIGALDRSFSADPAVVIGQARAFIEGLHAEQVGGTIKHFPGHGSATGDTHAGVVDVTDTWTEAELEPFAALTADRTTDAVLTAHVFNARLDPQHPASLSRSTISDILRQQLGWDGVVISDDLQMGAIRDAYGHADAARLAVEAGVDLLIIANQQVYEPGIATSTVDLLMDMVQAGDIEERRIDEAWRRITGLKRVLAQAVAEPA